MKYNAYNRNTENIETQVRETLEKRAGEKSADEQDCIFSNPSSSLIPLFSLHAITQIHSIIGTLRICNSCMNGINFLLFL